MGQGCVHDGVRRGASGAGPECDQQEGATEHDGVRAAQDQPQRDQQQPQDQGTDVGRRDPPATDEALTLRPDRVVLPLAHGRSNPVRVGAATVAAGVGTEDSTAVTTLAADTSFIHSSGRTVTRWSRQAWATALTSSGVT